MVLSNRWWLISNISHCCSLAMTVRQYDKMGKSATEWQNVGEIATVRNVRYQPPYRHDISKKDHIECKWLYMYLSLCDRWVATPGEVYSIYSTHYSSLLFPHLNFPNCTCCLECGIYSQFWTFGPICCRQLEFSTRQMFYYIYIYEWKCQESYWQRETMNSVVQRNLFTLYDYIETWYYMYIYILYTNTFDFSKKSYLVVHSI